jgi:hypothetical protein
VWAIRRKRDIKTQKVLKYKAGMNVHGGQHEYDVHYVETYYPVVTCIYVCLMTTLAWLMKWFMKWHTIQCNFFIAYPQEFDMYMVLPSGIQLYNGSSKTHVLRLIKNLCIKKQTGTLWNQHLKRGL